MKNTPCMRTMLTVAAVLAVCYYMKMNKEPMCSACAGP